MPRSLSSLRAAIGERPIDGIFIKIGAVEVIDLAAQTYDFGVVDLEHSSLCDSDAIRLVGHAHALGFPLLVRLPAVDQGLINRLLEAGAVGMQVSSVRTAGEVHAARNVMRYPPRGTRSVSLAHRMAGYGAEPLARYLAAASEPLLVAQIETADTGDSLEEIMAAAPDVVFIGTTDLAVDLGLDQDQLSRRIAEIAEAAAGRGIALGGFALARPETRYRIDSSDIALLRTAMVDGR